MQNQGEKTELLQTRPPHPRPLSPGGERGESLPEFQTLIRDTFGAKDARRGIEGTFMWFMQEVGELATALRSGSAEEKAQEFADVLAWLATLANIAEVDLASAVAAKYGSGCPNCRRNPCQCGLTEKP